MNKTPWKILIIGGGAAGVGVVAHLVDSLPLESNVEIALYEKSERIGPGLAYSTTYDANLLNTPAGTMGLYADNPAHFLEWLSAKTSLWHFYYPHLSVTSDATPPRSLYGLYLEDVAKSLEKTAAEKGIILSYHHKEITNIHMQSGKPCLIDADNIHIEGDIAILAIGGLPSHSYGYLKGIKGYIPSPYPDKDLVKQIPLDAEVCIIGSRLSAIDAILTLKAAGHFGQITCVSRSGRFPCVQGLLEKYEKKFLTSAYLKKMTKEGTKKLRLKELLILIKKEIEQIEKKFFKLKNIHQKISAKAFLRYEINASHKKIRPWQLAVFDTQELWAPLWQMLSDEDKPEIIKKYVALFSIYRAAMPLQTAENLYHFLKHDQLRIIDGLKSIKYDAEKGVFQAICANETKEFSYVINATGGSTDITFAQEGLLKNLRDQGIISPHKYGGIRLNENTLNVIDTKDHEQTSLYAIGAMGRGIHLITNVIGYIAQTSQLIANRITLQITEERSSHKKSF